MEDGMTYVHRAEGATEETRIPFDPERRVPDARTGGTATLYELYVRDCDEHPGEGRILDPDGMVAYQTPDARR